MTKVDNHQDNIDADEKLQKESTDFVSFGSFHGLFEGESGQIGVPGASGDVNVGVISVVDDCRSYSSGTNK